MKKASYILYKVAIAFSILSIISSFISLFMGKGIDDESLAELSKVIEISEELIKYIQGLYRVILIFSIVVAVVSLVFAAISISKIASKNESKGLYIAGIIVGALFNTVLLVAAILGLIAYSKAPTTPQNNNDDNQYEIDYLDQN